MAQMTYVCLYLSYLDSLSDISDVARGRLMLAMLQYAASGQTPRLTGDAKVLWPMIRSQIDRDMVNYRKICDQNRSNGRKGGRPRKNPPVSKKPEKAKEKENENENENEKENERESEKDIRLIAQLSSAPHPSFPPSEEEVRKYCLQQGLNLDASRFVDHYTSNGWMVGKNKMQDWQAAARNWNRKEIQFGKAELERTNPVYGTVL